MEQSENIASPAIAGTGNTIPKKLAAGIFLWMCAALVISALSVLALYNIPSLFSMLMLEKGSDVHLKAAGVIVLLSPFAFILLRYVRIDNYSTSVILFLFFLFSILSGAAFYFFIHLIGFDGSAMWKVFLSIAILFAAMGIIGQFTDREISFAGLLLFMGLGGIAVIVALNVWLHSPQVQYVISTGGIIAFTAISAMHMRQLKKVAASYSPGKEQLDKLALLGAFSIYVDFITLILVLIFIIGKKGSDKDNNDFYSKSFSSPFQTDISL